MRLSCVTCRLAALVPSQVARCDFTVRVQRVHADGEAYREGLVLMYTLFISGLSI